MSAIKISANDSSDLFTIGTDRCSNLVVNGQPQGLPFTQATSGPIEFSLDVQDLSIVNPDQVCYIKNNAGTATYICFVSYVGKTMYGVASKIDALLRDAQSTSTTFSQGGLTGVLDIG